MRLIIKRLPSNLLKCATELQLVDIELGKVQLLQLKLHCMTKLEKLCLLDVTGMVADVKGALSVPPTPPSSLEHLYLCTSGAQPANAVES